MVHISVVIPVYKAESCLEELYRRLKSAIEPITQDFEIVLIEDCGGDRSWKIIAELAQRDARASRACSSAAISASIAELPPGWTTATATGSS